ncbi:hypothetical protein N9P15_06085 [Planktomarina sp.]|nr:hypothetical protein [Planktomarina sp.]
MNPSQIARFGVAYLEISLRNSMSNGKESGMFFKAVVVVAAVTVAVVVAVGAGLAVSSYISKIDTGMTIKDVTDFLDEG